MWLGSGVCRLGVFQHTPVFYPGLCYPVNGQSRTQSGTKGWNYRVLVYVCGLRTISLGVPMVPGAGLEPARSCLRGIFLLTTAFAAEPLSAHLESGLSL